MGNREHIVHERSLLSYKENEIDEVDHSGEGQTEKHDGITAQADDEAHHHRS